VTLKDIHFDKYAGRVGGTVVMPDGRPVADLLRASGLVRDYNGGRHGKWC
jgi:hypothetical protein